MTSNIDIEKSININKKIVRAEVREMERKLWERSHFCECGADSVLECSCDKEKRRNYMQRASRKINEEYGRKAANIMMKDRKVQS